MAVLGFVSAALYAVLALVAVFNPPAIAALLHTLSPGGSGPEVQLRLGPFLPVYYVLALVGMMFVAEGLWKLRNWTRIVMLVVIAVSLVAALATAPGVIQSGRAGVLAMWGVRVGLCLVWGWYLVSDSVRSAFRSVQPVSS